MNLLRQEILTVKACEPKPPTFPGIRVTAETPSKKRKVDDEAPQLTYQSSLKPATYSSAAIRGVQSLDDSHQRGFHLLHQLVNDKQKQQPTSPRNICFGSAKNSGSSLSENTAPLSADVHLVASGVGKGCTPDDLISFLNDRGIHPVDAQLLTRKEVLDEVRFLTFRVVVKASEYEDALKPEVWPYRVAVRHYSR